MLRLRKLHGVGMHHLSSITGPSATPRYPRPLSQHLAQPDSFGVKAVQFTHYHCRLQVLPRSGRCSVHTALPVRSIPLAVVAVAVEQRVLTPGWECSGVRRNG